MIERFINFFENVRVFFKMVVFGVYDKGEYFFVLVVRND